MNAVYLVLIVVIHFLKQASSFKIGVLGLVSHARGLRVRRTELQMQLLKHGEKFKFMSVIQGRSDQHFPRIVPVAGEYPGITEEELFAPYSNEPTPTGTWAYDFSDPDDPQMGSFACPPGQIITEAEDPVAVIALNTALGLKVDLPEELECVVIVDRGDLKFKPDAFYMFKTTRGTLEIGASDSIPEGYDIMGRVILTTIPWAPGMDRASSGFLEDD